MEGTRYYEQIIERSTEQEMVKYPEVAILMATYNGEKYLSEQLDSLLKQKICGANKYSSTIY